MRGSFAFELAWLFELAWTPLRRVGFAFVAVVAVLAVAVTARRAPGAGDD